MRPSASRAGLLAVALSVALLGGGCQSADESGRTPAQEKVASDVRQWAKESGGDWSKLTPQQQAAMVQSTGSEGTAKSVLRMTAHPPAPVAPGPPAGWKPGGPPPNAGKPPSG